MITGLDTGTETFGWAQLDEGTRTLLDLGVIIQHRSPNVPLQLDRAERALVQASEVVQRVRGSHTLVIEAMSFGGGVKSIAPIALSFGVALGIAASSAEPPRVLTIAPQRWQREILPDTGKRVDYARVAAQVERFVHTPRNANAAAKLAAIPDRHRNHALDAVALALIGALRPRACMTVGLPRPRARRSKALRVLDEHEPLWMPREGLPPGGREECRHGERPCPYVHCKWHLWMVDQRDHGGIMPNGRHKPSVVRARWLEKPTPPCCALDVAELRRDRELPVDRIAAALGVTEDWASELVDRALAKIRTGMEAA